MQIGTRWRAGDLPHPRVPEALHDAITAIDREYPSSTSWTLTWLEGRPRCERGDGYQVVLTVAQTVRVLGPDEDEPYDDGVLSDDDWL